MSKKLDSLHFIPLWGDIGHLKGYIGGLLLRINDTPIKVEASDLEYLQRIVDGLEKHLEEALGYGEE